jgi:hypothetical protein
MEFERWNKIYVELATSLPTILLAHAQERELARIQRPRPCFLDQMQYLGFINGNSIWRSPSRSRYYTWDSLHGEIEVYNRRGRHLGVLHAVTGELIKVAVEGRSIDLS